MGEQVFYKALASEETINYSGLAGCADLHAVPREQVHAVPEEQAICCALPAPLCRLCLLCGHLAEVLAESHAKGGPSLLHTTLPGPCSHVHDMSTAQPADSIFASQSPIPLH